MINYLESFKQGCQHEQQPAHEDKPESKPGNEGNADQHAKEAKYAEDQCNDPGKFGGSIEIHDNNLSLKKSMNGPGQSTQASIL